MSFAVASLLYRKDLFTFFFFYQREQWQKPILRRLQVCYFVFVEMKALFFLFL